MEDEVTPIIGRFAPRLRELRAKAGLSQTELSKRSGVPQATVAAYEVGRHAPTWGAAVRIARVLGVSLDSFLVAPAEKTPEPKQETT